MLDTIEVNANIFKLTHKDLLDKDFTFEAIQRNGWVLQHLSDTEKGHEAIALAAIKKIQIPCVMYHPHFEMMPYLL